MDATIRNSELTARFINQKSYYRSNDQTVRHNAFMPNGSGETSIYRIDGLSDAELNEIGEKYVTEVMGKALIGRAEINVSEIIKNELNVMSVPMPHPRHANIINWPEERDLRKMKAVLLAEKSRLILNN